MHAIRDSCSNGRSFRRLPRAGILLSPAGEWWESYFDSQYLLEYAPVFTPERDRREAARVIDVLGLPVGSRILDAPCGQGRHAHLLAEVGFQVDGIDYSKELIAVAKKRGTGPTLRYTRADMRKLPARWTSRFDAVINLFTSFGFFTNPSDDARVIGEFARVLKPGGILIWQGASRDGVMNHFLSRDWWETSDRTSVMQSRSFDPLSGVLKIDSTLRRGNGRTTRREHRIRLYTATRLAELCAAENLIVEEAFDGFHARPMTRRSTEMLLLARKAGETE
ncbi:MAG TPA: class I SAM-dependent methyltransferase [Gemmatimonadaceae bacterium]|nr:class I SAM-dependent methyltransferase [Gemmatimonadaceae bacterium]